MSFLQRHQNHAVVDVDSRPVGEGEIVDTLRNADVVDDEVALLLRDDLADLVFDLQKYALGGLDARGGRGTDVELDLSAVNLREEIATNQCDRPSHQEHLERADIAAAKQLEAALERLVKTRKPAARARGSIAVLTLE